MKKGYTLIELMVVMMIATIISLLVFRLVMVGQNIFKSKELNKYKMQVISFVYYCQNYCKANEKTAYINFYEDRNSLNMILKCEGKEIKKNNIYGKNYKIGYMINKRKENYIEISNLGMINNEGEIKIEYGKNKEIYIFLGSGGVYDEY